MGGSTRRIFFFMNLVFRRWTGQADVIIPGTSTHILPAGAVSMAYEDDASAGCC